MTIRGLMTLGLPPLFLIMGAAMWEAADVSTRRELDRAVEDAAGAAVRSTATFVAAWMHEGRSWQEPLRRVVGFDQLRAIRVAPRAGAPVTAGTGGWTDSLAQALPAAAVAEMEVARTWVGPRAFGGTAVQAAAPLEGGGYVMAIVDVAPLVAHAATLRPRFARVTAFFILVGVLLALVAGGRLSRGVVRLGDRARGVVAGTAARPAPVTGLRELTDLSVTLETMGSILEESVAEGRRALLARSLPTALRTDVYRAQETIEVTPTVAGCRVTTRVVGTVSAALFAGAVTTDAGGCSFVGLASGRDDDDRALEAAAAKVWLESRLGAGGDPSLVVRAAQERFRLDLLRFEEWPNGKRRCCHLHTLGPEADRALHVVEKLFAEADQEDLTASMAGAVADLGPGVLMLIRPATPGPVSAGEVV